MESMTREKELGSRLNQIFTACFGAFGEAVRGIERLPINRSNVPTVRSVLIDLLCGEYGSENGAVTKAVQDALKEVGHANERVGSR